MQQQEEQAQARALSDEWRAAGRQPTGRPSGAHAEATVFIPASKI
eukprot:gene10154-1845_t